MASCWVPIGGAASSLDGMLVTDAAPRAGGALIDIELDLLDLEAVAETGSGVVVVAGQPIRIELVYKGTVPA
jgi:hypothetical protein